MAKHVGNDFEFQHKSLTHNHFYVAEKLLTLCAISSYFHCRSALPKNQPTHVPEEGHAMLKSMKILNLIVGEKRVTRFNFQISPAWNDLPCVERNSAPGAAHKQRTLEWRILWQHKPPTQRPLQCGGDLVFGALSILLLLAGRDEGHGGENVSKVVWEIFFGYTLMKESAREMCWKLSW